jgi:hypothetical protein
VDLPGAHHHPSLGGLIPGIVGQVFVDLSGFRTMCVVWLDDPYAGSAVVSTIFPSRIAEW